jgi:pimeloyl-ACP methyl ester carboxylesterase
VAGRLRVARDALPPPIAAIKMGVMGERFVIEREGGDLVGERWPGNAQLVVLLHEGVSDRRGRREVAQRLAPWVKAVAYDRRGYGESAVSTAPFTHAEDLLAVLDQEQAGRAWLVGASAGGGLALDAALLAPDRVAGLVLLGTAVSGAPEPELDPDTQRFDALLDAAMPPGTSTRSTGWRSGCGWTGRRRPRAGSAARRGLWCST